MFTTFWVIGKFQLYAYMAALQGYAIWLFRVGTRWVTISIMLIDCKWSTNVSRV